MIYVIIKPMKLLTRKQRISFDVRADLEARHRICAAFKAYLIRTKLIMG